MNTEPYILSAEFGKQVLTCYDARHRLFIKTYSVFITFGVGFLAFILVPLMGLKHDAESLPKELAKQRTLIKTAQPMYDKLNEKNGPLQVKLKKLTTKLEQLDSDQKNLERSAYVARESVEAIRNQIKEADNDKVIARQKLSAVKRALDPEKYPNLQEAAKRYKDKTLKESQALEKKISELSAEEKNLKDRLKSAEDKLRQIETKKKEIKQQAGPIHQQAIKAQADLEGLEEKLTRTRAELIRNQEALDQMEQRQIDIQNRLSSLQSPYGILPLSLTEASLAFPFIVAVGFLIYAMLLADLIRLRCEYHRLVSVSQKLAIGTIRHRLSLVVPLWLDPLKTLWRNCGGAALVFLPALGYFIIVWLVITGRFIDYDAKRLDRHLIGFYSVLYVAGALFIILGVWRILAEWMGYRTMLSTETLHPEVTKEQS